MTLFSQLLEKVTDQQFPVSSGLLLAKRLAVKLSSETFERWVDAELKGYPGQHDVPDYRIVRAQLYGEIYNCIEGYLYPCRLPMQKLSDQRRGQIEQCPIPFSVGRLEEMHKNLQTAPAWEMFISNTVANEIGLELGYKDMPRAAHFITSREVWEVLVAVRGRLQDFLLELLRNRPELEVSDDAVRAVPKSELDRTFLQTVNRFVNCNFAGEQTVNNKTLTAGGSITVGGHFVFADAIGNAFNNVGSISEDRRGLLHQLGEALNAASQNLPEDKRRQIAEDYQQLAEQAKKPEPNKRWVTASLEGIAEAAVTLATAGQPLLDLISRARQVFGL